MYKSLNSQPSTSPKQRPSIKRAEELSLTSKNCQAACCSPSNGLLYLIISLLLLIAAGFAALALVQRIQLSEWGDVCHSEACHITAGEMLSRMNTHTDPCEDFYEYSCGRYSRAEERAPETSKRSLFWEVAGRTRLSLKTILEHPAGPNSTLDSSRGVAKARLYYTACMRQDFTGSDLLQSVIYSLGGWPLNNPLSPSIVSTWRAESWSYEEALSKAHSLSVDSLFSMSVSVNERNVSEYLPYADQAGLLFKSSQVYSSTDNRTAVRYHQAYVEYFTDVARILQVEEKLAKRYAEDVWQFEKTLAGAFVTPEQRGNPITLYNPLTVDDLQRIINVSSSWHQISVRNLLSKLTGQSISSSDIIVVRAPEYFHRMALIVSSVHTETLCTYIVWSVLRQLAPHAGGPYRAAHERLQAALTGATQAMPLWSQCVEQTNKAVGFASGAVYAERFFTSADKVRVERLVNILVKQFTDNLSVQNWMDSKTKTEAKKKAEEIHTQIGLPEFSAIPELLDNYYKNLNVTDNPLENNINYRKFEMRRNTEKLGTTPDRNEWLMKPTEVNAYYRLTTNQIIVTAGLLQRPFYDVTSPASLVFGAMGFIVGHELIHGFDTSGRRYDARGNMANWWSDESSREYTKRSECFQDEYNFTINALSLNGLTTLDENIADNGGARLAYYAYQSWRDGQARDVEYSLIDRSLTDARLPGLNMTTDQQFFVSLAQTWCVSYTQEQLEEDVRSSKHSISRFRVNGVVRNMREFSEAFKCENNAAMNFRQPCRIW